MKSNPESKDAIGSLIKKNNGDVSAIIQSVLNNKELTHQLTLFLENF